MMFEPFDPRLISSNHTVTQNSDKFGQSMVESDEFLTPHQAKTPNYDRHIQQPHAHTQRSQAVLPMTDSSFHPQACRYDIIRLIMEQLIMTY